MYLLGLLLANLGGHGHRLVRGVASRPFSCGEPFQPGLSWTELPCKEDLVIPEDGEDPKGRRPDQARLSEG